MADRLQTQEWTALFIGHFTRSVLARLPEARVEWSLSLGGAVADVRLRVADQIRAESRTFPPVVDLIGSIREHAQREAKKLCADLAAPASHAGSASSGGANG